MEPFRIDEDGITVFTSTQIDEYGFPEWHGFDVYRVIETRACQELVTDFALENQYDKRPVHRYCRKKRFQTVLGHLLNDKGKVPPHIITLYRKRCFPIENCGMRFVLCSRKTNYVFIIIGSPLSFTS